MIWSKVAPEQEFFKDLGQSQHTQGYKSIFECCLSLVHWIELCGIYNIEYDPR